MISDLCICLSKCHTNSLRLKQYKLVHVYSDIILIRFGMPCFRGELYKIDISASCL